MADDSLPPSRPPSEKDGGNRPPRPPKNPYGLVGVGTELAGVVVILSLLGWWLDERWKTTPWMLLLGLFIGLVGGFRNLWKEVKRHSDD